MTEQEKIQFLLSPEQFWPKDISFSSQNKETYGNVLGNKQLIKALCTHVEILQESQYWNFDTITYIQSERLKHLVLYLSENSTFWSQYFKKYNFNTKSLNILNELSKLPILEREVYSRNEKSSDGEQLYTPPSDPDKQLIHIHSGGTTGRPLTVIRTTQESAIIKYPYYFRFHPMFDRVLLENMYNRKFIIGLGGGGFKFFLTDFIHTLFHITHLELKEESLRQSIYKTIQEAGPVILAGYASLLLKFAEYVEEDNVKLSLIAVRTGSEPISIEGRIFIEKALGVPVLNSLNFSEGGTIGFECPDNIGNFHVNSERVILEVVDKNGKLIENGKEGELLVTVLDSTTSPMIRYRIGDVGKINTNLCQCKRTLPLFKFLGRRSEELKLPSGIIVKSIIFYGALMRSGLTKKVVQFQLQQIAEDKIRLLIIPKRKFTDTDEVEIRVVITKLLNNEKMIVEVKQVEKIPSTPGKKPQFFVPLKH